MAIVHTKKSLVVKNLSTKDVRVFGLKIKPGRRVDLFKSIKWLEESRVLDALAAPHGELHRAVNVNKTLKISSSNFLVLANAARGVDDKVAVVDDKVAVVDESLNYMGEHKAFRVETSYDKTKKTSQISHMLMHMRTMKAAMSGVMELVAPDGYQDTFEVSASSLTDGYLAAVPVRVWLKTDKYNDPHLWANFDAVVSGTEDVADADVTAPTFSGINFIEGKMALMVKPDVGAEKTYVAGDSFEVTVKVSDDSTLLGYDVDDLVLTFNIV